MGGIELALLILGSGSVHPFTKFQIGIGENSIAEVVDEIVALWIGVGISAAFPLENGHHEVHVGMNKLVHLHAGRAMSARVR